MIIHVVSDEKLMSIISSFLSITKQGCGKVFHKLEKKFSKSFFDTLKPIFYHSGSVKFNYLIFLIIL
mgnify:CR=1 FL=1